MLTDFVNSRLLCHFELWDGVIYFPIIKDEVIEGDRKWSTEAPFLIVY